MSRSHLLFGGVLWIAAGVLVAPAAAQQMTTEEGEGQELVWVDDRPDALAPAGMYATRILSEGQLAVRPTFRKFDRAGLRLGTDFIAFDDLFSFFSQVPFESTTQTFRVDVEYGVNDEFTLLGRLGFTDLDREQITTDEVFFSLQNDGLTDAEVHGLWQVIRTTGVRAHLQTGVSIPLSEPDDAATVPGIRSGTLPYDLQTGSGTFGFIPGFTVKAMNDFGVVGAQVLGHVYAGENDSDWRPGNSVELNGWAAYKINDLFSISSGLRARAWSAIQGFDPQLDPTRDPGEVASSFSGESVEIPFGLNLLIGEGPLAGHRLGVEFLWNVHEDLEGPLLAADDGWVLSWSKTF